MTELFWKYFKKYEKQLSDVEKAIMEHDFQIFVDGNDMFEDMSAPEMQSYFFVFKSGWIAACIKRMKE